MLIKNNLSSKKGSLKNIEDDEEEDGELHGVVEEAGLSRTNIARKDITGGNTSHSKKSKKNQKRQMEHNQADKDTPSTTMTAEPTPASSEGGGEVVEAQVSNQTKKKSKKGYWGEFTAQPIEVLDGEVIKGSARRLAASRRIFAKTADPTTRSPLTDP